MLINPFQTKGSIFKQNKYLLCDDLKDFSSFILGYSLIKDHKKVKQNKSLIKGPYIRLSNFNFQKTFSET